MCILAVVTVEFDPASYSVMEGMTASIIVVVRGEFAKSVSVQFATQDQTAIGIIKTLTCLSTCAVQIEINIHFQPFKFLL